MTSWCRTILINVTMVSVALAPLTGFAEPAALPPLSLSVLLEEARKANPEIRAARARWDAAQQRVPLATGLPAPRIGIELEEIPRGTLKVDQATTIFSLLQTLPFPGKLSLRHRVALKEAQEAAAMFKQTEWEVLTQVKAAYNDLFLLDRQREIAEERTRWARPSAAAARARYATGAAPQRDALQAEAELLTLANDLAVLHHRRDAAAAHLNHLLDREGHAATAAPGPIPLAPVPGDPETLMAQALTQQPALLAAQFAAERAEAAWRLSKRELWPDFETMLALRNPAMGPIGPWDLSLALALPFWFWTKQRYGVKVAVADQASAAAAYQAMRRGVERQIHEHWHEASAAYGSAALAQDRLIPLARQAVASAMAAYEGGRGSFADMTAALQALAQRQDDYYRQVVSVEQHVAMLEQAVGVSLRGGQS